MTIGTAIARALMIVFVSVTDSLILIPIGFCIFILVSTDAHVIVHTGTTRLTLLVRKGEDGKRGAPIYKRFGSAYNFHDRVSKIRTQDLIIRELMHHNKRAAFQQVDIPTS
jgi:hypothetical protein